jgi:Yip1 domain
LTENTENTKTEETTAPIQPIESSTAMDLLLPLRVLVSPIRTFTQLAQRSTAKGLITLAALIVLIVAAAQYATATRVYLTIDSQSVNFTATASFTTWFAGILGSTISFIVLYWLIIAASLALIGRFFGGKAIGLRTALVIFSYMLSVFIVLYAVRTITYLSLPPITFDVSSWPPTDEVAINAALERISQNWGSLLVYQIGSYFTFAALAWLIILGAIAVKTMREISWTRAALVSITGIMIAALLFGLP